jgi:N-acetylglucosamine-6-phosphate deacetylase
MIAAMQNLVNHVGIQIDEALRMCSLYAARVAKKEHQLGKIAKGYKAKLIVLDNKMQLLKLLE